jgi:hypothetical protein
VRRRAADRACFDRAARDADACGSRSSALRVAAERRALGRFRSARLRVRSRAAFLRVCSEVVPRLGGASRTPARRALERPMAIACLADRAPCLPSRMSSISSRTNSPAWVDGDFPSRLSRIARRKVSFLGMHGSPCRSPRGRARFVPQLQVARCSSGPRRARGPVKTPLRPARRHRIQHELWLEWWNDKCSTPSSAKRRGGWNAKC